MMFYKELLKFDNLTTADKIIYSYLSQKAVSCIDDVFDIDGDIQIDVIQDFFTNNDDTFVSLSNISLSKISNATCFNLSQCKKSIAKLKDNYMVSYFDKSYHIQLIKEVILDGGYFNIDTNKGKLTSLMLFYFYLKNKAKRYNGEIDTWYSKLSKEYNTTEENVKKMVTRLKNKCLVERTEDNKLKIN